MQRSEEEEQVAKSYLSHDDAKMKVALSKQNRLRVLLKAFAEEATPERVGLRHSKRDPETARSRKVRLPRASTQSPHFLQQKQQQVVPYYLYTDLVV